MTRHLLTIFDLSTKEIESLLIRARELKAIQKQGIECRPLKGKTLGLLFEKQSTRTRLSFEVAALQLGGHSIYLSPHQIQMGRGEELRDTARVFSRYLDGVVIRTFEHKMIEEFAGNSSIPVINGLTDIHHPCQIISDMLTILEKKERISGIRLAYIGDGNNVAHSLIEGAAVMGMHIRIASPKGYEPDNRITEIARQKAKETGAAIEIMEDPFEAVDNADVVYTDVWTSMGQEEEEGKRKSMFKKYRINRELMKKAKGDAIILHCLPAHRGEEITDEMMESPQSVVFDQAENRLHMQKALLEMLMGNRKQ
ncbi:MAG: ornithine carbamoyltransferase [Nitrospirae bacterium RBG_16_43_11]|nr:MAG: ornithine carbamoyltransferase [Nitrospirae bacterium RBG_16_43_11]